MIIRAIKINDEGFCEKCPYQFDKDQEIQGPPSRSACISCRMKEKDHRIVFSDFGVVTHLGAKYLVCCDNAGYVDYELPANLRILVIEK